MDFIGHCGESKVIYYCVDEWTAFSHIDPTLIRQKESELLQRADIVFVVSEKLFATKILFNANTHLIPHGVNHILFRQALADACPTASELQSLPRPIIGCIGNIYDYFDQEFVAASARLRPQWSFVIVGKTMTDVARLRNEPNIRLIELVPYERLPEFCKGFAAGFVAYRPGHPFSINCNPLKIHEYLAAGLPVISLDIPAAHSLSDAIKIVKSPAEFIAATEQYLTTDKPAQRMDRSQTMKSEAWTARVAEIERILAA